MRGLRHDGIHWILIRRERRRHVTHRDEVPGRAVALHRSLPGGLEEPQHLLHVLARQLFVHLDPLGPRNRRQLPWQRLAMTRYAMPCFKHQRSRRQQQRHRAAQRRTRVRNTFGTRINFLPRPVSRFRAILLQQIDPRLILTIHSPIERTLTLDILRIRVRAFFQQQLQRRRRRLLRSRRRHQRTSADKEAASHSHPPPARSTFR